MRFIIYTEHIFVEEGLATYFSLFVYFGFLVCNIRLRRIQCQHFILFPISLRLRKICLRLVMHWLQIKMYHLSFKPLQKINYVFLFESSDLSKLKFYSETFWEAVLTITPNFLFASKFINNHLEIKIINRFKS